MIKMIEKQFKKDICQDSLVEFSSFLRDKTEIEETGNGSLQEFFINHSDLLLLMGDCFFPNMYAAAYQKEFSILGEFRADFAISNSCKSKFLFVEFEPAKRESVFAKKTDGKGIVSYEWSDKFEHGFSQILDWHYRMEDLRRTARFQEHFGSEDVEYEGILVVGRDCFVKEVGGMARLNWRKDKTVIDSRKIYCMTYDKLFRELQGRMNSIDITKARNT